MSDFRRRLMCKKSESDLPSGYTRLNYLESTGAQWIDTGVNVKSDLKIDITLANTNTLHSTHFLGGRIGFTNNAVGISKQYDEKNKSLRFAYSNNYYDIYDIYNKVDSTLVNNYVLDNNYCYINGTLINVFEIAKFETDLKVYIFTANNGGSPHTQKASIRLYNCKIYDSGKLVRNYIPALYKNGKPCLYDTVSKQPFYNQGTGEFLYG